MQKEFIHITMVLHTGPIKFFLIWFIFCLVKSQSQSVEVSPREKNKSTQFLIMDLHLQYLTFRQQSCYIMNIFILQDSFHFLVWSFFQMSEYRQLFFILFNSSHLQIPKGSSINDVRRFLSFLTPHRPQIRFCPILAHSPIL